MLALAVPMTLLFLGTEVIAHISDRRKARAALAGDDLLIRRSAGDDKVLRELSKGDDGLEPPTWRAASRLVDNPPAGKGRTLELLPPVAGMLRDGRCGAFLERDRSVSCSCWSGLRSPSALDSTISAATDSRSETSPISLAG